LRSIIHPNVTRAFGRRAPMLAIAGGRRIMAMGLIKFMTSSAVGTAPRRRPTNHAGRRRSQRR
jgi:hypothetical protein